MQSGSTFFSFALPDKILARILAKILDLPLLKWASGGSKIQLGVSRQFVEKQPEEPGFLMPSI